MKALSLNEFTQLMSQLGPFEPAPILAVATSGGPDSLALTLLTNQWAKAQGGKIIAITVDHLLRDDSTDEAHQVKEWLEARGIEHHILTWVRNSQNEKPKAAIQALARESRYRMLGQWCMERKIKHLLTAHHAQDQLETFMIRLAKGSGLKGLTSTQEIVPTKFGRILRPLLTIDANRLKETLKTFHQPYLLDPSNENEDFTRIRWRQLLPMLAKEGLNHITIQQTLARLSHAQRLIDQHISALIHKYVVLNPLGYALFQHEGFQESEEAIEEMLKRILATVGTQRYPIRRQALHRAMEKMRNGHSFTLGGCQISLKSGAWWIAREPAAIRADIWAQKPSNYLWDNRFMVTVSDYTPCRIAPLRDQGIQQLEKDIKKKLKTIPYNILKTLPALWHEEKLVDPMPPFIFSPHFPLF